MLPFAVPFLSAGNATRRYAWLRFLLIIIMSGLLLIIICIIIIIIIIIIIALCGPDSSVGIAIGYGLDGPGIESR
jgi:hypothetical protein